MNTIMQDFLWAPILSLFSRDFYRRILQAPLGRGFLYLAYLSLIFTLGVLVPFTRISIPVADELIQWVGENLPPVTLTQKGLQMSIREPRLLSHPRWGDLIYLDPTADTLQPQHFDQAVIILTRTKAAYRNAVRGNYQTQDLVPKGMPRGWRDLVITGERVINFWSRIRPFLTFIFLLIAFFGIYLWKLLAGFLYSLIALLLNLGRRARLSYGPLLNLTFFALTPATLLQTLAVVSPSLRLPLNFLLTFTITTVYLAIGILTTQENQSN